jgi:hypothetical protein
MKTIAQQLNIKEFPFRINDKNGNLLYAENSNGFWYKYELDENGNLRFFEDSNGYWCKYELDEDGNERYFEDSKGEIRDNRVKEMTIAEIENALNIKNLKVVK